MGNIHKVPFSQTPNNSQVRAINGKSFANRMIRINSILHDTTIDDYSIDGKSCTWKLSTSFESVLYIYIYIRDVHTHYIHLNWQYGVWFKGQLNVMHSATLFRIQLLAITVDQRPSGVQAVL